MRKKRQSVFLIVMALIVISVIIALFLLEEENNDNQSQQLQHADQNLHTTLIASFTQQPSIIFSVTPFYGEVLYNEAIRQITQTPEPNSERDCWLIADYRVLSDLADELKIALSSDQTEVHVEAFSSRVWNSKVCNGYLTVSNQFRVWININSIDEINQVNEISKWILDVLHAIDSSIKNSNYISEELSTISLGIYFVVNDNTQQYIVTNWKIASKVLIDGLEGENLITTLGGLQSTN